MSHEQLIEQARRTRFGENSAWTRCTAQRKRGAGPCCQPATKLSLARGRPLCQAHGGAYGRDKEKLSPMHRARQADFRLRGQLMRSPPEEL